MTWRAIDSDAATTDRSLPAGLGRALVDNLVQDAEDRIQACGHTYGVGATPADNQLEVSTHPEYPICIPLLVPAIAGATHIRAELRYLMVRESATARLVTPIERGATVALASLAEVTSGEMVARFPSGGSRGGWVMCGIELASNVGADVGNIAVDGGSEDRLNVSGHLGTLRFGASHQLLEVTTNPVHGLPGERTRYHIARALDLATDTVWIWPRAAHPYPWGLDSTGQAPVGDLRDLGAVRVAGFGVRLSGASLADVGVPAAADVSAGRLARSTHMGQVNIGNRRLYRDRRWWYRCGLRGLDGRRNHGIRYDDSASPVEVGDAYVEHRTDSEGVRIGLLLLGLAHRARTIELTLRVVLTAASGATTTTNTTVSPSLIRTSLEPDGGHAAWAISADLTAWSPRDLMLWDEISRSEPIDLSIDWPAGSVVGDRYRVQVQLVSVGSPSTVWCGALSMVER